MANRDSIEGEIWKDVQGFEGLYQVSSLGNVRSVRLQRNIGQLSKRGYMRVRLFKGGKMYMKYVSILVATAFIKKPTSEKVEVSHINEDRSDNRLCNLVWESHKDNCSRPLFGERQHIAHMGNKNAAGHGLSGKQNPSARGVLQYSLDGEFIRKWDCITDANMALGIGKSCISNCCRCKSLSAGGYVWKYV